VAWSPRLDADMTAEFKDRFSVAPPITRSIVRIIQRRSPTISRHCDDAPAGVDVGCGSGEFSTLLGIDSSR
jgi:hypothetical protein